MITSIGELLTLASQDKREEPEFFRALLDATVYAHISVKDRTDLKRLRFIQFAHPQNGQLLLPFFTDETKAREGIGADRAVFPTSGRVLFELTRGATLMLNPNDQGCILYPEEVVTLLETGYIATVTPYDLPEGNTPLVGPWGADQPAWLMDALTTTLAKLTYVEVAYEICVFTSMEPPEQSGFLIAIGSEGQYRNRTMHAVTAALQPVCMVHNFTGVDLMHFDPHVEGAPNWVNKFQLRPFYDRSWGARLQDPVSE